MRKVALHNLGCKVNAYETEAMQEMLESHGYEIVPFKEGADIYIINTCTVTNIADRKSRQMLHKAKKMNPDAIVVAAGCYVQTLSEEQADSCIDIIIGNNKKQDLISILQAYEAEHGTVKKEVIDINDTNEYESLKRTKTGEHTRAYIKVQDGCNQFCSYCIIPYARGRVRSRKKEEIVEEVTDLVKNGYQEIVLTGIHLSSYGVDRKTGDENKSETLLSLILAVNEVEGLKRIRLGSLEPRIITEEFASTLAGLHKICPHFHLSLQSGCDETLKRMNRRYTAEEFKQKCVLLRHYFQNPALTTDIITGFPQENEEEFEASYQFVDDIDFYETHVFKYSKRKGTKAAAMEGQIEEQVKAQRSARLLELNKRKQKMYESSFFGNTVEVLLEEQIAKEGKKYMVGHTKEYLKIRVETTEDLTNQVVEVKIDNHSQIIH